MKREINVEVDQWTKKSIEPSQGMQFKNGGGMNIHLTPKYWFENHIKDWFEIHVIIINHYMIHTL